MAKKKFLIVDDDERFALLAFNKLEPFAKCYMASDGEEAVLCFEHHFREGTPFDAVFMDIEMPDMSGHHVIRKLREIESGMGTEPLKKFKLVMLTGHSDVKNVCLSFFRGHADAYIPKKHFREKLMGELKEAKVI